MVFIKSIIKKIYKNDYILLSIIIFLVGIIIYSRFIFTDAYFIFTDIGSDTVNSYWPLLSLFSNLFKNGFAFFSMKIGLGANLFSGANHFLDPFNIFYIFFDEKGIAKLLIYVNLVKILLSGLFFMLYIKMFVKSRSVLLISSFLYAFNGFMIVWGQHYFFANTIVLLPLVMLGVERIIRGKGFLLLVFTYAGSIAISYYFSYMFSILIALYVLVRLYCLYGKNIKKIAVMGLKVVGSCLLGMGLASIILFPTIYAALSSVRIKGQLIGQNVFEFGNIQTYFTILGRLFSNDLLGFSFDFFGWGNFYEAPILYCGLLTLLIIPQLAVIFRERKGKHLIFTLIILGLCLVFPYMSIVFNGFSAFTYRWTFILIFIELLAVAIVLEDIVRVERINTTVLKFTFIIEGLILFCVTCYTAYNRFLSFNQELLSSLTSTITVPIAFSYAFSDTAMRVIPILAIMSIYFYLLLNKNKIRHFTILLISVIVVETILFSIPSNIFRKVITESQVNQKWGYFDDSKEAVESIKNNDKGLYRIEKSFFSQFWNDSMIQDYRGLHAYWNVISQTTFDFFNAVGGYTTMPSQLGFIPSDIVRSMLSVKYYLVKTENEIPPDYTIIGKKGDVLICRNDHYVPMGSVFHNFIREKEFEKLTMSEKEKAIAVASVLADYDAELAKKFGLQEVDSELLKTPQWLQRTENIYAILNEYTNNSLSIQSFKDDLIKGTINTEKSGIVFLPVSFDLGWQAFIDNQKVEVIKTDYGFIGIFVASGTHYIEFKYVPPFFYLGCIVSIASILLVVGILLVKKHKFKGLYNK